MKFIRRAAERLILNSDYFSVIHTLCPWWKSPTDVRVFYALNKIFGRIERVSSGYLTDVWYL